MKKPPIKKEQYNQHLSGIYGKFGTGADCQIFYIQTAIRPSQLDKLTLISDIKGAETWSVRDLFQREVDNGRITSSLIPYLQDQSKVKFFNPLTLTVLPMDPNTHELQLEMPQTEPEIQKIDGDDWSCIEQVDCFRFRQLVDQPEFGGLDWNDVNTRIVAIDGQHRLSALKRLYKDKPDARNIPDFDDWVIPAVLFSTRALSKKAEHTRVIDVVRSIFVYINTEARPPSETRKILLSDSSVNDICTQEVLEYAHANDVRAIEDRVLERIPLMCFDWRGQEHIAGDVSSPAALKKATEIRDWLEYYILGPDFDEDQEIALGVEPTDDLKESFVEEHLGPAQVRQLRKRFGETVLPGLAHLLENFGPYGYYIKSLREIEDEYTGRSDIARYAFHKIRFGDNPAPDELHKEVNDAVHEIMDSVIDAKEQWFSELISFDIGMRSIVYAFGSLKPFYDSWTDSDGEWLEYSKWYVAGLNALWSNKWLQESNKKKWQLLHQICRDHNERVINYRLEHVPNALGALVVLLVAAYGSKSEVPNEEQYEDLWGLYQSDLYDSLFKGFKSEVRAPLREKFPQGGTPLNEAVKEAAMELAGKQLAKIQKELGKITA